MLIRHQTDLGQTLLAFSGRIRSALQSFQRGRRSSIAVHEVPLLTEQTHKPRKGWPHRDRCILICPISISVPRRPSFSAGWTMVVNFG
jgi:hypothetical protein